MLRFQRSRLYRGHLRSVWHRLGRLHEARLDDLETVPAPNETLTSYGEPVVTRYAAVGPAALPVAISSMRPSLSHVALPTPHVEDVDKLRANG